MTLINMAPLGEKTVERMLQPHFFIAHLEPYNPKIGGLIELADITGTDLMVGHIESPPVIREPLPDNVLDGQLTHRELLEAYRQRALIPHPDLPANTKILVKAYSPPDETYIQPLDGQTITQPGRYLCTVAGIIGTLSDDDTDQTNPG